MASSAARPGEGATVPMTIDTRFDPAKEHLLHYRRLVRSPMIEPGKGGAYLVLFSEIGLVILVTTLVGTLAGYWLDKQIGTIPVFVLVGLLVGLSIGARAAYRLITRFLARFD